MKPAFGSISEIKTRLKSALSAGQIEPKQISGNCEVEVEGVNLTTKHPSSK